MIFNFKREPDSGVIFEGTKFCIDTVNNQLSIDLIKKSTQIFI